MRVILLTIFLISSTLCFSQNNKGVAIYTVKTNYAFNEIDKVEQKEVLKRIFEESGKESSINFKLIFNNEKSVFFAEKALNRNDNKVDLVSIKAKILGKIFVNLETKEIIQHKEKFGETFNINSSLNEHEWILTKEQLKIGKYSCYKAILKSKKDKKSETIAWYAPELASRVGPLGYCGLPGLVIILKDDIFIYSLKEIIFNLPKQDDKTIHRPKTGMEVSIKEYDSIYKIMREKKDKLERESYN
ncbi:MAG: GLPGLI family protein [Lutibacter sp.]|uniref:GLPGLI family protein n=1 Tax=Lutibacter sp. TaxID=1925666 RepID=UPI0019F19A83|nr:GLPGLI family protein [Lutibacter sp.]NOR26961.1 GLPGLI family protein [Lutibacter sp.]